MTACYTSRGRALLGLASLLALGACEYSNQPTVPAPRADELTLTMYISSETASPGEQIAISIAPEYAGEVTGVQGFFNFDATRLRYVGQGTLDGETYLIVNKSEAGRGQVRLAAMNSRGLRGNVGPLVFEVLRPGYALGLEFQPEEAATAGNPLRQIDNIEVMPIARLSSAVRVPSEVKHLTMRDWIQRVEPGSKDIRGTVAAVPGQIVAGLVYGNVNLNTAGQQVTLSDAIATLAVGVGLNEMIINTDAPAIDAVIAMNVEPANSPGLGEPTDALPPGNATATDPGQITLSDAIAILSGAVGNPQPIVNQPIPGRPAAPATNRVIVSANITTNTTWTKNNIYELQGGGPAITVTNGATLTIEPGTRIEGQRGTVGSNGAALFVQRDGRILADGTAREPITFTCVGTGKFKGCWGGLVVNGTAPLNEGTATSPVVPGRDATGGCLEKSGEGASGLYGGCNPADSSGVIRYVVIEYSGFKFNAVNELNGFAVQGVGNKTVLDYIQVHGGLDDCFEFFGGTAQAKHLVLTHCSDDSLDWVEGFSGKIQYVIVQQDSLDGDKGIEADNTNTCFDCLPRALPQISNMTIIGRRTQTSAGGTPGPDPANDVEGGMHIRRGTRPTLHNVIVMGQPFGLDLDDTETCVTDASGGPIQIRGSMFFVPTGGTLANSDGSDPAGCGSEDTWLQQAAFSNLFSDPLLRDPWDYETPDFRPANGSSAANGVAPPADPFFDASATFRGAVPPANTANANVPWYAGWTRFGQ